MLRFCIVLFLTVSFVVSGCTTVYNPATGKQEFIFITTPAEVSIGNTLAEKISRQFEISKDHQKIDRVVKIGKKIASVSDRKDLEYHFNVIEDEDLNAFTTPGGYIYINSGIIEKSTDNELACVIGHEIGHIAARHIAKKIQAQIGYDILMNIAASRSGLKDIQRAASISYDLVMLGYSREDELLADKLGAKYAYKAGYDPNAMITFLEKLKDTKKEGVGFSFLRSHPYTSERIKALEREIPALKDKPIKKTLKTKVKKEPKVIPYPKDKVTPLKVKCPVCKRIFSGKTNYCPYDGTKLK